MSIQQAYFMVLSAKPCVSSSLTLHVIETKSRHPLSFRWWFHLPPRLSLPLLRLKILSPSLILAFLLFKIHLPSSPLPEDHIIIFFLPLLHLLQKFPYLLFIPRLPHLLFLPPLPLLLFLPPLPLLLFLPPLPLLFLFPSIILCLPRFLFSASFLSSPPHFVTLSPVDLLSHRSITSSIHQVNSFIFYIQWIVAICLLTPVDHSTSLPPCATISSNLYDLVTRERMLARRRGVTNGCHVWPDRWGEHLRNNKCSFSPGL